MNENSSSPSALNQSLDESVEELYQLAPCGYLTTAADGTIIRANTTLAGWLGYESPAPLLGRRLVDLLTVGGRIFYETHLSVLLRMQSTVDEIALDLIGLNNRAIPVLCNARQKRDAQGEPILNRFTIFNATDRRNYERGLLEARNLFQTTLSSIGDGVIATDLTGSVTFMNPVAEKLSGWTQDSATGKSIDEILNLSDEAGSTSVDNPLYRALSEGVVVSLADDTFLTPKGGTATPIDDSAAPIRNAAGEITGGVMVFRNISGQKDAERALTKAHQELQRQAAELRRSNDALSQFSHIASHDLQSPLNTITAFTQLLERKHGEQLGDGQRLLAQIVNASRRMRTLIDSLLTYALATQETTAALAPVDANVPFRSAVENLDSLIEEFNATVTSDHLPTVLVDEMSLIQIFQNLIGNAIRYRSTEPPKVYISVREKEACWQFACQDNGIGIDVHYLKGIFEAFKRLHGADRPGSGLGLATCQRVIERYGGKIWAESQIGSGSTFFFTIPKVASKHIPG